MIPSPSLYLVCATARLAGRAFAQLRSIIGLAGPVVPTALPHRAFMVQPGPCAVTVIQFASRPPVQISHQGLRFVEDHSTGSGTADAQILFAGFANGHG